MITFLTSATFILLFSIISAIIIIVALEMEREGVASTFFSLAIALVLYAHSAEILAFLSANVLNTVYFAVGYVILGLGWSFLRWNEKVKSVFRKLREKRDKFTSEFGRLDFEENQKKFNEKINYDFKDGNNKVITIENKDSFEKVVTKITPKGIEHKALIVSWISYWPLSIIGTLLNNPFRRFFNMVYESVSGFYDEIAKRQKNNILKD